MNPMNPRPTPAVLVETSAFAHSTQAEPALRLRPRRAWLPRAVEAPAACGWYESSRELRQGLAMREWDADNAPVPLEWFGLADVAGPADRPAPQRAGAL